MSLALIVISYLLLAVESPLLYHLDMSFYAPDIVLIVMIFAATRQSVVGGALVCMVIGLLKDGFALGPPLGMYTEITVILYFAMRFFSSHMSLRPALLLMGITFMASVATSLLFLALSAIFDRSFGDYHLVLRMMFPQALVTAPFAPPIFWLLQRIERLTVRKHSQNIFFG